MPDFARRLVSLALFTAAALLTGLPAEAQKKHEKASQLPRGKAKDYRLPAEYLPITEAERKLSSVPFAPEASAVVLFEGKQEVWNPNSFNRHLYHLRTKILTEAGVEKYGDFERVFYGDWEMKSVQARTVLPDGTVIPAEAIQQESGEKSSDEVRQVKVVFPRVQVGAILDVVMEYGERGVYPDPLVVQWNIPVIESRLVFQPPGIVSFFSFQYPSNLPDFEQVWFPVGKERGYGYKFRNVPAFPDEANAPPDGDLRHRLIFVLRSVGSMSFGEDWKSYVTRELADWRDYFSKSKRAKQLAKQLAVGETPLAKAEAIRQGLRERFAVRRTWHWVHRKTADEALQIGHGTSADLAGLTIAMLRAVGVRAQPVYVRSRDLGGMVGDIPVPVLFSDTIVRLPGAGAGGSDVYYSPAHDLPAGRTPPRYRGVAACVVTPETKGLTSIPDVTADENRTVSRADLKLAPDGAISGTFRRELHGVVGDYYRIWLANAAEHDRKELIEKQLRTHLESATVSELAWKNVSDHAKPLVLTGKVSAPRAATRAGKRLLFNPRIFDRVDASEWAAETRALPVQFDMAFEEDETVVVEFPEGTSDIKLPSRAKLDAPDVGLYHCTVAGAGMTVTSTRRFRMDAYGFGTDQYPGLRGWFNQMAEIDSESIVATVN
ncbi:MAG: DUF3857 and transglutaminase domain-containing protein [Acidobacteriota bacterium]